MYIYTQTHTYSPGLPLQRTEQFTMSWTSYINRLMKQPLIYMTAYYPNPGNSLVSLLLADDSRLCTPRQQLTLTKTVWVILRKDKIQNIIYFLDEVETLSETWDSISLSKNPCKSNVIEQHLLYKSNFFWRISVNAEHIIFICKDGLRLSNIQLLPLWSVISCQERGENCREKILTSVILTLSITTIILRV